MLSIIMQVWGGVFYLLNKIFFCISEHKPQSKRIWRICSWIVYLIGLPAWVIIFIWEHNWIAASIETGGALSMALGLIIALRGKGKEPRWLNYIAVVVVIFGITYSLYDFGGITTINQVLELGIVIGFLIGTYMLAKERPTGYLWFLLMNGSNSVLMYIQDYPVLCLQQIVSFIIVFDAYRIQKKKANN